MIFQLLDNPNWQTKLRGTNAEEYELYLNHCIDSEGKEITSGLPKKTFDEWLEE